MFLVVNDMVDYNNDQSLCPKISFWTHKNTHYSYNNKRFTNIFFVCAGTSTKNIETFL